MSSHRVDPISLFGGVVFLSFGVVGLLHTAGWIDRGSPVWVAVAAAAALGAVGVGLSLRGALRVPRAAGEMSEEPLVADATTVEKVVPL